MKNLVWYCCGVALMLSGNGNRVCAQQTHSGPWVMQVSGTSAGLRGIHAVGGGVAWASGTKGTVLRTEDSGYMWQGCAMPPGAENLDFRGIWAWDQNTALVMSSGPGDLSRIYKTTDGCSHWKLLYTDPDKDGFWDAMQFSSRENGVLIGDPVNHHWTEFHTEDGGNTWIRDRAPSSETKENPQPLFAASNSSLQFGIEHVGNAPDRWVGTGGPEGAAVYLGTIPCSMGMFLQTRAKCRASWTWERYSVPMTGGDSAGVFSLGVRINPMPATRGTRILLVAVGGDYQNPDQKRGTAAYGVADDHDVPVGWNASERPPHGYRSAVAWDSESRAWIAVGTNGSDISYDDGKTWSPLDNGNWNALSLPWVVGPSGRIAKLDAGRLSRK